MDIQPSQAADASTAWLPVAAVGITLLVFAVARRAERMYQRVMDLNRDRLDLLERGLQSSPLRSRLEALALQVEHAAPASAAARRLLLFVLLVQWAVCLEAVLHRLATSGSPWAWMDATWVSALVVSSGWMWRVVGDAARAAEETTAHARRYEFLLVSSMRKKS
ncbi:MAG: hypothetical protein HZB25_04195 [Candidatus Eisenbacteria bacterium]|nr:hypothetical protein [Candidatus Eisenbacteria bacterium]